MSGELSDLQNLIERFETARAQGDTETLDALNEEVRPCVDAAMAGVREGRLSTAPVREAAERLQFLTKMLATEAESERESVAQEIRGIRHNQSAVKAYGSLNRN